MKGNVSVIGAGTAGLILAKRLRHYDIEASVYDQKEVPGHPSRASGIISINGLRSLGVAYKNAVTNTLYGAGIHAGRMHMHVESADPMAHVVDRKELNAICMREAEESGAEIILGRRIDGKDLDGLANEGLIVGADGAVSSVANHFGMGPIERYVLTYRAEFSGRVDNVKNVDIFLDNSITTGFFGWLSPNSKDILEVGIGISPGHGNAKRAFDKFVGSQAVEERLERYKLVGGGASMIPIGLRRRFADDRKGVLLVGDAAGHVKPSTGGGVVYGGMGAIMAATAINNNIRKGISLEAYEKAYRKRYWFDLMLHSAIQKAYSGFGGRGIGIAIRIMNVLGLDAFLGRYGDMDAPSLIMKRFIMRDLSNRRLNG